MTPEKTRILVVDDQAEQRELLHALLSTAGFPHELASGPEEALQLLKDPAHSFDLVLSDLQMKDMNGIELMERSKIQAPDLPFILVTAQGSIETAVEAMKKGAFDYLLKPLEIEEVLLRIRRLASVKKIETRAKHLERENRSLRGPTEMVAASEAMKGLIEEATKVARSNASVLLIGETGVGKEVLARKIHELSSCSQGPFIAVNCSAIPENLLESEFFGHEKGAFTGADRRAIGYVEAADGGTLFLDEIGEMDLKLQPKLLRAIEERKIRRVGSTQDIPVAFRIIAATHRDLKTMVSEKKFREDLYFRLNVVQIAIPPLRSRRKDLPEIVQSLVKRHAPSLGIRPPEVDPSFLEALSSYPFPGNVRELANLVERSLIYCQGPTLTAQFLPEGLGTRVSTPPEAQQAGQGSLSDRVASFEKRVIQEALSSNGGDVDRAAVQLDIARSTLYTKMQKHGIHST